MAQAEEEKILYEGAHIMQENHAKKVCKRLNDNSINTINKTKQNLIFIIVSRMSFENRMIRTLVAWTYCKMILTKVVKTWCCIKNIGNEYRRSSLEQRDHMDNEYYDILSQ